MTGGPFIAGLVGLLVPRGCAGCDRPDETVCPSCRSLFDHVIARPLPGSATGMAYACAAYERRARRAILAWKDHGDEECDRWFSLLIAALAARVLPADRIGEFGAAGAAGGLPLVIVPAPSTARSLRTRGRRHLMPLAGAVAAYYRSRGVDARVERALEFRTAGTGPSTARGGEAASDGGKAVETVGAGQRASRTGGRLVVRAGSRGRVCGGAVVIVDDIVTTGATMRACAAALESAGARVVAGLALAATPRYGASAG